MDGWILWIHSWHTETWPRSRPCCTCTVHFADFLQVNRVFAVEVQPVSDTWHESRCIGSNDYMLYSQLCSASNLVASVWCRTSAKISELRITPTLLHKKKKCNKCIGDGTKAAARRSSNCIKETIQEVKVIWQIPRLGVTPGGRNLYHWIPRVGFPISVRSIVTIGLGCIVWPQCMRVTTNQPTTNDVTTQPISISASFTKVKWGA